MQTDVTDVVDGEYIGHDSLVKMKCKHSKSVTIGHYCVLAIFSKYTNIWFVHLDSDCVLFEKGSKRYKFLVRMVQKKDRKIKEVDLENDENW